MCFFFLSRLLVSSHEGWYQSRMGRNKRIHKNATELCDHIMASGHLRQNNDVEKDHYYLFRCDKWLHSSWSCRGNYWFNFVWPVSIPSSIHSIDVNHNSNASISDYDCLHRAICCTESSPMENIVKKSYYASTCFGQNNGLPRVSLCACIIDNW